MKIFHLNTVSVRRQRRGVVSASTASTLFTFVFAIITAKIHKHSANTPEDTGIFKIAPGRFSRISTLFNNNQRHRRESGSVKVNSGGKRRKIPQESMPRMTIKLANGIRSKFATNAHGLNKSQ